jgi:ABC-type antimicrobial peptide transport system permease subunit
MIASGYTVKRIRKILLKDHFLILILGLLTGSFSAICATWPSVASGADLPWGLFITMLLLILITGYIVLSASVNLVNRKDIIVFLRGE